MAAPVAVIDVATQPNTIVAKTIGDLTFSQALDGTASTPSTGGASIASYAWTILDKPDGSSAQFADTGGQTSTLAEPTIENCDTWGNYRIFLVVTDNVAATSESDLLKAPNSAFGVVRVKNSYGLQKLAKGERNYQKHERDSIEELHDLRTDFNARTVNGIFDVVEATSTGPSLDNLMDGSYATNSGLTGGTTLHNHKGTDVDAATTGANGTVTPEGADEGVWLVEFCLSSDTYSRWFCSKAERNAAKVKLGIVAPRHPH